MPRDCTEPDQPRKARITRSTYLWFLIRGMVRSESPGRCLTEVGVWRSNMTLPVLAVSLLLGQSAAPSPLPAVTCAAPPDAAVASLCAGEDALKQGDRPDAADDERDASRARAVAAFRRAADLTRDPAIKKRALTQLERLYDADHLDLPRQADP